jgi:ketosteroid isomerase-like protein
VLSAEDRFAIEALHNEWLDAELRRDTSGLLQLCTAMPVWLPPNESPLCGRPAIVNWLEARPRATVRHIDIDNLAIAGLGSIAWKLATFHTTMDGPADAGAVVVTGTHGWLLQRDEAGTWRIAVVTWTIAAA